MSKIENVLVSLYISHKQSVKFTYLVKWGLELVRMTGKISPIYIMKLGLI